MVERNPTLRSSSQKLPRPPESEMPARMTPAMTFNCSALAELGLKGPLVAQNSTPAKPTKPPADVKITVKDGSVYLNDTVKVVTTDIETSNGVIHVIDGVLLPPAS